MVELKTEGKKEILHQEGNAQDIVNSVLAEDKIKADVKIFARRFTPDVAGLKKLHDYFLYSFRYIEDPEGKQIIKTPAKTLKDGYGDCKTISITIAAVLKYYNIPYQYNFISQDKEEPEPTHVYITANLNGRTIILDPVFSYFEKSNKFNKRPPHTYIYKYGAAAIGRTTPDTKTIIVAAIILLLFIKL